MKIQETTRVSEVNSGEASEEDSGGDSVEDSGEKSGVDAWTLVIAAAIRVDASLVIAPTLVDAWTLVLAATLVDAWTEVIAATLFDTWALDIGLNGRAWWEEIRETIRRTSGRRPGKIFAGRFG